MLIQFDSEKDALEALRVLEDNSEGFQGGVIDTRFNVSPRAIDLLRDSEVNFRIINQSKEDR